MSNEKEHRPSELRMIPLDRIEVLNPRERNSRVFEQIVGNIQSIGLKKPIIVTPRPGSDGEHYLLICGEGRFKAFKTIGQQEIPAMVMNVDDESAFIMSLTENIARRKFSPLELLVGIEQLRDQGYDKRAIAQKTGLSPEYVQGILYLLKNGEERLLMAVGSGRIPLNAAGKVDWQALPPPISGPAQKDDGALTAIAVDAKFNRLGAFQPNAQSLYRARHAVIDMKPYRRSLEAIYPDLLQASRDAAAELDMPRLLALRLVVGSEFALFGKSGR